MVEESLAGLLLDHPAPAGEALVSTIDTEWTKAEFLRRAHALAGELRASGVGPHTAVAVKLSHSPQMAAGMFATWLAGAVFVPVNPRQPEREAESALATLRPAAVLDDDGLRTRDEPQTFAPDTAFVTWTSGTTGPPKPILQTHSGYREILGRVLGSIRNTSPAGTPTPGPRGPAATSDPAASSGSGRPNPRPAVAAQRTTPPSPNLVPVSLALNAGIYNLLFGFMAGAPVVLMDRFTPEDFATLVDRYQVRSTVLPPAAMVMLTDAGGVIDLAPLRYVRSITAPLTPLAARRFMAKFGVTVLNGYGQAEIGEVIGWTAVDAREHPDKLGAVGRPHAGVEIKVVDDDGATVGPDQSGQLLVRPPRMAAGYAGGESMEDRVDRDGYVRTGDYATIDADGFVWIEGRSTDLINRGGNKVFPEQVEEVLMLHPEVREAAVAGVADARLGEVPVAFIVGAASDIELADLCREHLVPYKIPIAFERVDTLPRTEVGKVLRRELAIRHAARGEG